MLQPGITVPDTRHGVLLLCLSIRRTCPRETPLTQNVTTTALHS